MRALLIVAILLGLSAEAAFAETTCGKFLADLNKVNFLRRSAFGEIAIRNQYRDEYLVLKHGSCANYKKNDKIGIYVNHQNSKHNAGVLGISSIVVGYIYLDDARQPEVVRLLRVGKKWRAPPKKGAFNKISMDPREFIAAISEGGREEFNQKYVGIDGTLWFDNARNGQSEFDSWEIRSNFRFDESSYIGAIGRKGYKAAFTNSLVSFLTPGDDQQRREIDSHEDEEDDEDDRTEMGKKPPNVYLKTHGADCLFINAHIQVNTLKSSSRYAVISLGGG